MDLIGERAEGAGDLLKERVGDVEEFIDAVERVAAGGTAGDRGCRPHAEAPPKVGAWNSSHRGSETRSA
jgi:hypothetical protein